MSSFLPGHDPDSVRMYCTTPECETTWKRAPACPICNKPGVPGSSGAEPPGWLRTTIVPGAITPRRVT